ncbi:hypothetical protein [uncultured Imperialibacter sp.]|uniref:hypothetical protein n=1 Tax=uncultured Imperialibacter sp. TaxID=1672639 RepID=UPI0030DB0719|tara:strand:- start:12090 stop:12506 length:417 start_codon:yes stop_codon:yes gene_type:complete
MNPILKNIISVVIGVVIGSIVNMGIVMISGFVIPPPEGADVTTMEGLQASLHLFEPRHFIMPFLAHALGTLAGAMLAGLIAANNKMKFSVGIGVFFLAGGITNAFMLPGPIWFAVLDMVVAYIPMGFIAGKMAVRLTK